MSMKLATLLLMLFAMFSTLGSAAPSPSASTTNTTRCPMDMNYVGRTPWNSSMCQNFNEASKAVCCGTLLSLFGIALAQYLKETSLFHLQNLSTSISCLEDFQSKLTALSLPNNLVSSCFDPLQFVITPNICAHIQNTQDWINKLAQNTSLDTACKSDLSDTSSCDACTMAGARIQKMLTSIDGNSSHSRDCFYFAILYAAGIVNDFGPESSGAVSCIFKLSVNSQLGSEGRSHQALVFGLTGAGVALLFIITLLGLYICYGRKWRKKKCVTSQFDYDPEEQGSRSRVRPNNVSIWFKIEELEKATNHFSSNNFIGRGGSGMVYKGVLPDGTMVAIKRVLESDFQGDAEFCNEVEIVSDLKHRNLVPLRGCCLVDEEENYNERGSQRYLVYEYMPNGNLKDHLFPSMNYLNPKIPLTWHQRKNIILDVARGLAYLHYGVKPAIYHRDIKATNILLDADMTARVADFGLAKQSRESQSHLNTRVAGTHGYLAPEYALYGHLTEKNDVYGFGVVVLEIMCRRKALDLSSSESPQASLITDWAWSLVKAGKVEQALDDSLLRDGDSPSSNPKTIMERFLLVGILCSHVLSASRPTISEALKMLEGDIQVPQIPDRPIYASQVTTRIEMVPF